MVFSWFDTVLFFFFFLSLLNMSGKRETTWIYKTDSPIWYLSSTMMKDKEFYVFHSFFLFKNFVDLLDNLFFIIFVARSSIFKVSVSIAKIFTFTWNKLYCDVFWCGFVYYNYKDFCLSLLYPLGESDWFNIDSWPYLPQ